MLPGRVLGKGVALGQLAGGVDVQELGGDFFGGLLGLLLGSRPVGGAQAAEPRSALAHAHVLLYAADLINRDVEAVFARVADRQVFAFAGALGHLNDALELADAVLHVDDVVAPLEVGQKRSVHAAGAAPNAANALTSE